MACSSFSPRGPVFELWFEGGVSAMVMSKALAHRFGKHFLRTAIRGRCMLLPDTTSVTATSMSSNPAVSFAVRTSSNTKTPKITAVTGSKYSQYGGGCRSYILYGYGGAYKRNGCNGKSCKCQRFGPWPLCGVTARCPIWRL